MKTITIGDIHGKNVWKQIDPNKYDKIIFVGDYVDDYPPTTDNQIIQNLFDIVAFKRDNPDKVVLLYGNHDLQYLNPRLRCSGYRPSMALILGVFFNDNRELFQHSFQIKKHIWTHGGITYGWFKNILLPTMNAMEHRGIKLSGDLATILNMLADTSYASKSLYACGYMRDGLDPWSGPLWADKTEFGIIGKNLPDDYHQIVGHSKVPGIKNTYNFANPRCNSSIQFVDCLDTTTEFYEVEIT